MSSKSKSCIIMYVPCYAMLNRSFSRQEYWSGLPYPPPEDLFCGINILHFIFPFIKLLGIWFFFSICWVFWIILLWMCLVPQSCLTLYNPMDCSTPDSFVHGILHARILDWVAMPSSMGSSQPKDQTQVSHIAGGFSTVWATREAHEYWSG